MSGQHIDNYGAWHAPPSTSVTGTSELFSSTYAILTETPAYPDQWAGKAGAAQSILFEQPQIQPAIGNNYDPPVRFDPPYSYRQQPPSYVTTVPAPSQYSFYQHQQRPVGYPQPAAQAFNQQHPPIGQQFYQPTSMPTVSMPQTQNLLMAQSAQSSIMKPEPIRPASQKNNRSNSNSNSPPHSVKQNGPCTTSNSDEASLNSPALTSSGSAASGTPPLTADNGMTDLEGTDEERVMCMACRGVYPSRRSLTGHIGRNEKCREIIGRNYLDALASGTNPPIPGTDAAIKSGAITTGQDGMSPVCPYCDRFISHYKGNIRRHINQCCKNTEPLKRSKVESKESTKNGKKRRKTEDGFHNSDFNDYDSSLNGLVNGSPQMSPNSSSYYGGSDLCSPNTYSNSFDGYNTPTKKEQSSPDDAYICEDCDFVTVYKGNMKRHLNTCHPLPDCKNLKVTEWDIKLEAMRASNLGIVGEKLQEKLAAHKQNSSRGRKPRKKKDNQSSEESEPLEEYKPNLTTSIADHYVTYA